MRQAARFTILAACFALLVAGTARAGNYELPLSGKATVTLLDGRAATGEGEGEVTLTVGDELTAPAQISVADESRLELLLPEGSVLRFSSNTEFTLVSALANIKNRQVEVDVAMGECWASVKGFLGETEFEVNSPTAVAGVAGTRYRLKVVGRELSSYYVYQGEIKVSRRWTPQGEPGPRVKVPGPDRVPGPSEVSPEQWTRIVSAGYVFTILPDGAFEPPTEFDLKAQMTDPWVSWNMDRDKSLNW